MGETIERAILSVINQNYGNYEFIIMDGKSTDGTVDVIKKYSDRIDFWESNEDKGVVDAFDKALSYATGDLIGFLGADDWYELDTLSLVAEKYKCVEDADLLYGNVMVHGRLESRLVNLSHFNASKLFVSGTQYLGAVCAFIKRELYIENESKPNNRVLSDYLFFLRLYAEKKKFVYVESSFPIVHFSQLGNTSIQKYKVLLEAKNIQLQIMHEYDEFALKYGKIPEKLFAVRTMGYYKKLVNESLYFRRFKKIIGTKDYIIFGAGKLGIECAKILRENGASILCFIDNDVSKLDREYEGLRVYSPLRILGNYNNEKKVRNLCIVVSPFPDGEKEIQEQLLDMNVDKDYIAFFSDMIYDVQMSYGVNFLEEAYAAGEII